MVGLEGFGDGVGFVGVFGMVISDGYLLGLKMSEDYLLLLVS
jgi:hypothetical protein